MFRVALNYVRGFFANVWFERLVQDTEDNFDRAATFYANSLKIEVSVQYPPASRPGDSPARRTGRGQNSIYVERPRRLTRADLISAVGFRPEGFYMPLLDAGGIPFVAPRPFVQKTFEKNAATLLAIMAGER